MTAMSVVDSPARRADGPVDESTPLLSIDLSAVAANTRVFTRRAGGELMAVVKADGFGHGAADVARTALTAGATWLGVTSLSEAVDLRQRGIDAPILSWLNPIAAAFEVALTACVDVGVPSADHLDAVVRRAPGARVHLMIDTGMARDGCPPSLWSVLCRRAAAYERSGLITVVGVMGHLPMADVPADRSNSVGRQRFQAALAAAFGAGLRPVHHHLAATAATLNDPASHHTLSRVGAGLVGIDPTRSTIDQTRFTTDQTSRGRSADVLRPALSLRAPLVEVRRVAAGTSVGYGRAWRARRPTTLGLLPLGYADGLPRIASGRAFVSVAGHRCPLVGTGSMDMSVVDLGPSSEAHPGTSVLVFGPGDSGEPTVTEWASWAGTIEHEIVTGIGARVSRRLIPAGEPTTIWQPRVVRDGCR